MGDAFFATGVLSVIVAAGVIALTSIPVGLNEVICNALSLVSR